MAITKKDIRCKREAERLRLFCKQHRPRFWKAKLAALAVTISLLWSFLDKTATLAGLYRDVVEPALVDRSPGAEFSDLANVANDADGAKKKPGHMLVCVSHANIA